MKCRGFPPARFMMAPLVLRTLSFFQNVITSRTILEQD